MRRSVDDQFRREALDRQHRGRPPMNLVSIAGTAALTLVLVTFQVLDRGALVAEDSPFRSGLLLHHNVWVVDVAAVVTTLSAVPVSVAALLVLAGFVAWQTRAWHPLVVGSTAVGLFGVTVVAAKLAVGRARPPHPPTDIFASGSSFPSGHTTAIVVLAGCVLLLAGPFLGTRGRSWFWILAPLTVLGVGLSRLYLDQHWLSDILASWALGILIVSIVAVLTHRTKKLGPGRMTPQAVDPLGSGREDRDDGARGHRDRQ